MDRPNVVRTNARSRRSTIAVTCLLALVGAALGSVVASGAAAANPAVKYVALGDSYTADPGVSGLASGISPLCLQSSADYPHQVGAAEGFATTDVSCSGATSGDMTASQYPGVAPQFDALTPATGAVTVGIGGNDNNLFIGALVSCGIIDLPDFLNIGAPCQFVFGNTFANAVAGDASTIGGVIRGIHSRAPAATVFVVGYPDILPQSGQLLSQAAPHLRGHGVPQRGGEGPQLHAELGGRRQPCRLRRHLHPLDRPRRLQIGKQPVGERHHRHQRRGIGAPHPERCGRDDQARRSIPGRTRSLTSARRRNRAPARCGLLVAGLTLGLAACSSTPAASTASTPTTPSSSTAPGRAGPGRSDAAGTVWLCRPGLAKDPCTADLSATAVRADGSTTFQRAVAAADAPVDCFYVYPTVSQQPMPNANLDVDPQETAVAIAQASRFSQVCKVYAPMYPQLTRSEIANGVGKIPAEAAATAYLGVVAAWKDYLAHDNHGRGVVLIGHSQGASLLIPLIRNEIDPNPTERRLLVSALLMGGNVTVPAGRAVGGDFQHVPACSSDRQTGCVVAYSSFDQAPPPDSLFGRVGTGIAARSGLGRPVSGDLQVLCTNPAALGGGTGMLEPYFPHDAHRGTISTPWVTYPGLYTATCENSGGASWLQVDSHAGPGDRRPVVSQGLGPTWGLHLVDVNIALGNLVSLVRRQAQAFAAR